MVCHGLVSMRWYMEEVCHCECTCECTCVSVTWLSTNPSARPGLVYEESV